MASKRRIRRKQCGHKIKYETEDSAWAAARALIKATGDRIRAYRCKSCGGRYFHIGHVSLNH